VSAWSASVQAGIAPELYAEAVREYVAKHRDDDITARLNEVYEAEPELAELDPVLAALQFRSLPKEDW
jgi:hypothetical protein